MKKTLSLVLAASYFMMNAQESKELTQLKISSEATVSISSSTQNPNFIRFGKPQNLGLKQHSVQAKAAEFISKNFKALNLNSADDVVFQNEKTDSYGLKTVVYQQIFNGVPVYDGLLKFNFNQNEELTSINGNIVKPGNINVVAQISKSTAEQKAISVVSDQNPDKPNIPFTIGKSRLVIFPKGLAENEVISNYLVYEIEVTNKNNIREFLFIDAHNGKVVDQFTGIHNINRRLYEVNTNPSNLVWQEGDPFPGTLNIWQQNEVVVSEHMYNLFKNAFGYISYDGADHMMTTINNNPNIDCPNANWNGSTTNYCDGTASDDVVAHEWGHAYTEYTSGLIYQYQSGALNESYSDVWGETIDIINNYQDTGENLNIRTGTSCSGSQRWKMGEDASAFGGAIRDMWNPNCNGDPGSVLDSNNYYCGTGDSGGVHSNSGVPNHLYALLVDGGTYRGYTINGIGFVKAAHLWWRAQFAYLTATSNFASFADALEASCNDLVGVNLQGLSTTTTPAGLSGQSFTTADLQNLQNAILAVQLRESPNTQCNYQPILDPAPDLCEAATNNPLFTENWENGLGNWVVTQHPSNASTWESRQWTLDSTLPAGRAGQGIQAPDPINGDCNTDLQNGMIRLESPLITFPTFTAGNYQMAFNHYVATEGGYDGGNIKYSVNGSAWTTVPNSAFTFNNYNRTLVSSGNDNPLAGQSSFSGTDGGSLTGSWGQSVINLSNLGVTSGSTIKFRFEFGTDGCNGNDGWYLDEIVIFNCSILSAENVNANSSLQVFPNPTTGIVNLQSLKNHKLQSAEVFDATGKRVQSNNLKTLGQSQIDLSSLPKGTYLMKVITEQGTETIKIIKK